MSLQKVDRDNWVRATHLLLESKVEYRNTSIDTDTQLVLDTFVGESLVLRSYVLSGDQLGT